MTDQPENNSADDRRRRRGVRPSWADRPGMREALGTRALQKNPADRYPTGTEMAMALRDCGRLLLARGL